MLVVLRGLDGGGLAGLLVLDALVDQERGVAAVVEDHVRAAGGRVRPGQRLLRAPPVLFERLALPGEDRDALGVLGGAVRADRDSGRGVVLGGEDVAGGPTDLGAESGEGLDQHGGLHGHVQRAGDAGAGQRLRGGVLLADRHQAGHLVLGEGDLLAAEGGEGQVGDLEVLGVGCGRHSGCSRGRGWLAGSLRRGQVGTSPPGVSRGRTYRMSGTPSGTAYRTGGSAWADTPLPWPQRSPSEALSPSAGPRGGPPDRHQQRRLALGTNLHRSPPGTPARPRKMRAGGGVRGPAAAVRAPVVGTGPQVRGARVRVRGARVRVAGGGCGGAGCSGTGGGCGG